MIYSLVRAGCTAIGTSKFTIYTPRYKQRWQTARFSVSVCAHAEHERFPTIARNTSTLKAFGNKLYFAVIERACTAHN